MERPQGTRFLVGAFVVVIVSLFISMAFGAIHIPLRTIWQALVAYDSTDRLHQTLWQLRFPRELGALLVGAALAVSGAIMQGVTRNPLADPGLLGLNAGASLALAIGLLAFKATNYGVMMTLTFVGAAVGALLVVMMNFTNRGGLSPLRLTLAGAAVTAFLTAVSEALAIGFQMTQSVAFWTMGGMSATTWGQIQWTAPVIIGGLLVAMFYGKQLTVLSFGEELARGLGQRVVMTKLILLLIVVVLAGTAVSLVGSISFVGLLVPHVVRKMVGSDYRLVLPGSALLGAAFVIIADTLARVVNIPFETPIGAVIAFFGVPFFIYLARKSGGNRR